MLTIDLLDLAAQLNQTAEQLPPNYADIGVKLKNDAIFIEVRNIIVYNIQYIVFYNNN